MTVDVSVVFAPILIGCAVTIGVLVALLLAEVGR